MDFPALPPQDTLTLQTPNSADARRDDTAGRRGGAVPVQADLGIQGEERGMTGNDVLELVLQVGRGLLGPEVWRAVLLLVLLWGVLVLVQIRRLLGRLVEEIESRPFFPQREDQVMRDDLSIT
jgi:hypothetical protein